VAHIPAGATLLEAATLPMNGLAARLALDLLAVPAGGKIAVPARRARWGIKAETGNTGMSGRNSTGYVSRPRTASSPCGLPARTRQNKRARRTHGSNKEVREAAWSSSSATSRREVISQTWTRRP
jgi:hypothetical protein